MSFPRYAEYKDSGVVWLGDIPSHWDVKPLKWVIARNDGGVWGNDPTGEDDTVVLRSTEQTVDGRWQLDEPALRSLSEAEKAGSLLATGDLLVTKSSGSALHIGKTTLVTPEVAALGCCYSNFMQRIRLKPEFDSRLAWYLMNNEIARTQFDLLSNSTTGLANLNGTMLGELVAPIPSPDEQTEIVSFLDRETAKIDALVAEQEQLITLLKEKRQAVISHAVTKGLDPSVPMKDSGVEWLGEVPAHWAIAALNYRYEVLLGKMLDEKKISGNHLAPYLRNVDVQWDRINIDELPQMDFDGSDVERYGLRAGDLLVCEGGDVGRAAIWQGELTECYYQKALHRLRPRDGSSDLPRFQFYLMQAAAKLEVFTGGQGKATIAHLTAEALRRYRFAYPTRTEQEQIVEYLDEAVGQFDELILEAARASQLLQERRSALISAAVTGQIDVRGLAPAQEQAA